jgi:hypothetical protein
MDPKPPPMSSSPSEPLSPAWVAWINQAALEVCAEEDHTTVDDLVDDAVTRQMGNPLHQSVRDRIRYLNPDLFRRLVQAKALAPFVVWLVKQKRDREMELRRSNVMEASSRAALEVYGPFLGPDPDEENEPEEEEIEPGIPLEMVEYLARVDRLGQ